MTHPNAIPTADLPGLIARQVALHESLRAKPDADFYDLLFQEYHLKWAHVLRDELARRDRPDSVGDIA